jgi:propionyl-CoA synthetase
MIADQHQYNIPSTIDDLFIMEEIKSIYQAQGIGIHK